MTFAQVLAGHKINCAYPRCHREMHRVPQAVAVNWGGLPPHLTDRRSPELQQFIQDAPERQAKYLDTERKK